MADQKILELDAIIPTADDYFPVVDSTTGATKKALCNQDSVPDGTTNKAYTATEKTKLSGIEAAADVTDAVNVAAAGAAMSGGAFHDGFSDFVANEHIDWTADQGATNIHSGNIPDLSATYAAAAKGVTNGDSHDHSGGDGAQIAYSSLSGTPTIPVKATGAELDTGTDDDKFATAKALADSAYAKTTDIPVKATGAELDTGTDDAKFATAKALADSAYAKTTDIPVKASGAEVDTGTDDAKFATAKAIADSGLLFNVVEDTTPQLGGELDTNNKSINRKAIPSADNTAEGDIVGDINAGETVAFPNIVYLKSDGKWWLADADAIASACLVGMALESKNADQAVKVLLRGFVRDDDWAWTVAGRVYLSTTAGALTQTAPSGEDDVVQVVGVATHADRMYFFPTLETLEYKA